MTDTNESEIKIRPLVICGPSGCGKTTIIQRLMKDIPDVFEFSISYTTRPPRDSERNGVDYHFISKDCFQRGVKKNEFIEFAMYSGHFYGTHKSAIEAVLKKNKICILDIDSQGVAKIKKTGLNALYVFIRPPNFETLEKRLRGKSSETEDRILQRLAVAHQEMEFGYKDGMFDLILINDELEKVTQQLKDFIAPEIENIQK